MSERFSFLLSQIFILMCLFQVNHSANVLCMFTSPHITNLKIFMAVANTLIERDHNLTIVTTIPIPIGFIPKKNFRHIFLEIPFESARVFTDVNTQLAIDPLSKTNDFKSFFQTVHISTRIQRNALMQSEFKEFFAEENKFDLMILGYLLNDFMVGVAPRYDCPIAIISLSGPFGAIGEWIGNPSAISYVQVPFVGKSQPMSFIERFQNLMLHAFEPVVQAYSNQIMDDIYR
ncbi:UDP-glucosyltransferase 2-like isoform X6 [Episyrphus balteatus]|nr:UDP-glucosyltransferase 2-like isoform X6 [Episyrphus balteatus]